MSCQKCGEVCHCPMEPPPSQTPPADSPGAVRTALVTESSPGASTPNAWRDEISARLDRYRSRRKAPPPRYPSLRLPFGPAVPALKAPLIEESLPLPSFEDETDQALTADETESLRAETQKPAAREQNVTAATVQSTPSGAKIIEFPRLAWGPSAPVPEELAEPVIDRPRILEVPEVTLPPPALGGITIEPARVEEPEKQPGIDVPLQSAPLGRRLLASLIDGLIIVGASTLFGFVFWKIALVRPPQIQFLSLAGGVPCLFWAAYQYLLIVYAGSTPGLRIAGLQLSRFDGTPTKRSLRRWRVLASYLSAASLGMGYAWLFLDEQSLCWHDRITRTYMAPRKHDSKS